MASCGGITYEDFTNIQKNTKINTLGNDASRNMQVQMKTGSWISQRAINFGTTGAAKYMLRAKGTGTVEIRFGRIGAKAAATIDFSSTEMEDQTIELDVSKFQGVKNVYFVVTAAENFYVDAWQFTEVTDGIHQMENGKATKRQSFDVSGQSLSDSHHHRGIIIEQYTDENGVKRSRKRLSGKE